MFVPAQYAVYALMQHHCMCCGANLCVSHPRPLCHLLLQRPPLESLKLQQSVRNSVQDAVESLGGRVTVGDVSARAGVKISEAEEALNALAADTSGTLEVSPC